MDRYCPSDYWNDFCGPVEVLWADCELCGHAFYLPDAKDPDSELCDYCFTQRC